MTRSEWHPLEALVRRPGRWKPRARTVRFGLLWFGYWAAYLTPVQLVLPNRFDRLDLAHKVRDFGLITRATGIAALVALPLFGALCDRSRSRFGRRKVWMAAGTLVFAVGLVATGDIRCCSACRRDDGCRRRAGVPDPLGSVVPITGNMMAGRDDDNVAVLRGRREPM